MRIAELIKLTEVEGPGRRAALWLQGCSIRCPGCCNPEFLDPHGGQDRDPLALADELAALPVEGLTLLGGEPLDQAAELEILLRRLRARGDFGVILFTGYPWNIVRTRFPQILDCCDLVKAGPFEAAHHPDPRRWIGSTNQTIHALTDRYRNLAAAWPAARREIEIHLRGDAIVINGTPLPDTPWPGPHPLEPPAPAPRRPVLSPTLPLRRSP
ncbi:MAG: Ribonucleotide reductase of class III (anaerobic), activating protein [Candidatus Ozemobacter sibiricus]|jgi:anaerobic ribonucleoside-triphosphate reductase activating protein|uniref:Ribonucleotide reductase of class III (Anaerobic), activating protein n=1 Tax=Candidatus Ozemobacter sibiricus TaxID=2268124 RepID=A0A367ZU28_9BACT|nr:MAG: Ribonucleotide reductase of class III (anaerobic), activating protein [Candidatus Ozemobacter sibiricus]